MTEYEAIDLLLSSGDNFDSIFGYWISVTFAAVAATYVVRDELSIGLALTIAGTYVVASLMFMMRFATVIPLMTNARNHPEIPPEFLDAVEFQGPFRAAAFFAGFLLTEAYVLYTYLKRRRT
jgi:hypothetical protein